MPATKTKVATIDLTPEAFRPSNPNAQKNIEKANNAVKSQERAILDQGEVLRDLFKLMMNEGESDHSDGSGDRTSKGKKINIIRDSLARAFRNNDSGGYYEIAERWIDAIEAKESADVALLESVAGK